MAPRHTGCAGAHLKSCRDEPGDCEAIRTSKILERAQLRCLYTTVHSAGSKQEELEATMLLKAVSYLSFLRWDECHDWGAAIDGYSCAEGTGEQREGEGLPSTSGDGQRVKSCL